MTPFVLTLQPPLAAEYLGILFATSIGIAVMGGVGYFVKLVHIPIKEILVGAVRA